MTPQDELFELEPDGKQADGPVECLGITFPNDEARREHFLGVLREKLKDPEFRSIEGFPIGSDEDILALSDPPYYTACPNPFLADFIKHYGKPYDPATDDYRREPFATDVSEGKNDPLYNVHSYHTKVPPKAIQHYIRHYTIPGDLVLDCFCGTGMTGVAINAENDDSPGDRYSILVELSPAASSIANGYNSLPFCDPDDFRNAVDCILEKAHAKLGYLYETKISQHVKAKIDYTVWSDVFICSNCSDEFVFWDAAVDEEKGCINAKFTCPSCGVEMIKRKLEHATIASFDSAIGKITKKNKQVPVLIAAQKDKRRFTKIPDNDDLKLLQKLDARNPEFWFPTNRMMNTPENIEKWGDKWRAGTSNFKYVHEIYTRRHSEVLGFLWNEILGWPDDTIRETLRFVFTATCMRHSLMNTFRFNVSFPSNVTLGTLYIASLAKETNFFDQFRNKALRRVVPYLQSKKGRSSVTSTQSATDLRNIPSCSADYAFIDPPFGDNLAYSELNFSWESWLKVFTCSAPEAVVSSYQQKGLDTYQTLMRETFAQVYRCLKPGRWMTIEFHNSKNAVWNSIQEAILSSGFVVADVRVLDKQGGSFNAVNAAGAVKQDLVISAYKPNDGLEDRFKLEAGTEEGVWDFVRTHLKQLPVFVAKDGEAEAIAERQNFLLFDRMVAFHVQRGVTVPLSAAEFYAGLIQRFSERDGMFFLPEQASEYDKKRMTVKEVLQLQLFVTDEASAIQWLKQQLTKKPQTFQDIHPQFMKEIGGWQKHEKPLELSELLEQNFLRYDGKGDVPNQIHSYLSTNFKELRNLPKDDESLRTKAKDRWYVPDPNKAGDLEKLRERSLLREFAEYLPPGYKPVKAETHEGYIPGLEPSKSIPKGKKLKIFRLEAVRAGFKQCWQNRDYRTIIAVAQRIPETVLQEDPKLLMWYDQALTRTGD